tara:strand:+ start:74 stop:553 length:480 start_codon:yes stop_codon:yes gene_type:complete
MNNKNYCTPAGREIIVNRIKKLKEKRNDAIEDLKNSTENNNSDLSENNEYLEAKSNLDKIESDLIEYQNYFSNIFVVDVTEIPKSGKVIFGSTVKIVDVDTKEEFTYQIVGQEECNKTKISYKSPIGKALLGEKEGEEVIFDLPNGEDRCVEIISIEHK